MVFSLKAMVKSFGFQWILVGTWMNKMGDNTSYLAQLCTTNFASSHTWLSTVPHLYSAKTESTGLPGP